MVIFYFDKKLSTHMYIISLTALCYAYINPSYDFLRLIKGTRRNATKKSTHSKKYGIPYAQHNED